MQPTNKVIESVKITVFMVLFCFAVFSIVTVVEVIYYSMKANTISGRDARSVLVFRDSQCGRNLYQDFIAAAYITNTSDIDVENVIVTVKMFEAGDYFTHESNYFDSTSLSLGAHETSLLSFYPTVSTGKSGVFCKWFVDNAVYK
ncbi:MAG: hypothetical protein HZB50_17135 [Chloroflexi bacterium]|nr:hypothetical protein [Chloroflexota bacterium]